MATKTKLPRLTKAEIEAATRRGDELANLPIALVSASLDEKNKAVRLRFRAGVEISIPIKAIDEIATAPIAKLRDVEASLLGDGLLFDTVDAHMYVPGLVRDLFGESFLEGIDKIGKIKAPAKRAAAHKGKRKAAA